MLVFTEVSSINTRWVESSSRCSRIQRRRARATSARSCSLACRTFFKSDAVAHQKTKQRRAAPRYSALVHRRDKLIQRPVPLLLNKPDNFFGVLLQRRAAPAARLGLNRPLVPPRLMPPHRRGDADTEAFRRLIPCRSLVNRFNHSRAQVRRIRSGHGSLTKPNHPPRLRPSALLGNPDSDPTETALGLHCELLAPMGGRHFLWRQVTLKPSAANSVVAGIHMAGGNW